LFAVQNSSSRRRSVRQVSATAPPFRSKPVEAAVGGAFWMASVWLPATRMNSSGTFSSLEATLKTVLPKLCPPKPRSNASSAFEAQDISATVESWPLDEIPIFTSCAPLDLKRPADAILG